MARVLVTGSSGFIGTHLVRALAGEGHAVFGLDIRDPAAPVPGVQHHRADLLDADHVRRVLTETAPEVVLHLAARTDLDETRDLSGYAANFTGVEHLLAAVRVTPSVRRCVGTSSQLVCRVGYVPTGDEDYCPSTLYGESKVLTERVWRREEGGGAEWCLVRPTTIWGPGMNPHYLRFFGLVRRGRYFHVGGGPRYKSYGYVGNTVHQYGRLLVAPARQIHRRTLFLADYQPITLERWADALQTVMGAPTIRTLPLPLARLAARLGDLLNTVGFRRFPFNSFRLGNVLTEYVLDLTATESACGPLPYGMPQGVEETVRWLQTVWGKDPEAPAFRSSQGTNAAAQRNQ